MVGCLVGVRVCLKGVLGCENEGEDVEVKTVMQRCER